MLHGKWLYIYMRLHRGSSRSSSVFLLPHLCRGLTHPIQRIMENEQKNLASIEVSVSYVENWQIWYILGLSTPESDTPKTYVGFYWPNTPLGLHDSQTSIMFHEGSWWFLRFHKGPWRSIYSTVYSVSWRFLKVHVCDRGSEINWTTILWGRSVDVFLKQCRTVWWYRNTFLLSSPDMFAFGTPSVCWPPWSENVKMIHKNLQRWRLHLQYPCSAWGGAVGNQKYVPFNRNWNIVHTQSLMFCQQLTHCLINEDTQTVVFFQIQLLVSSFEQKYLPPMQPEWEP